MPCFSLCVLINAVPLRRHSLWSPVAPFLTAHPLHSRVLPCNLQPETQKGLPGTFRLGVTEELGLRVALRASVFGKDVLRGRRERFVLS